MSSYGGRILGLLLLLMVGVWAGLSYIGAHPPSGGATPPQSSASEAAMAVRHAVSGGAHMYTGSVEVPACEDLSAGLKSIGVNPAHLTLLLTFIPSSPCIDRAMFVADFELSYEAGESAPVVDGVTLNGAPAKFSLVEGK